MRAHVSIRKYIGQLVSRSPLSFSYVRKFGSPLVRAKKLITEHTHAPDKYNRYSLKIKFVLVLPTLTRAPERYFLQMLYTSNMCIHRSIPDYLSSNLSNIQSKYSYKRCQLKTICLEHNDPEINTDAYENGRDSKKKG